MKNPDDIRRLVKLSEDIRVSIRSDAVSYEDQSFLFEFCHVFITRFSFLALV